MPGSLAAQPLAAAYQTTVTISVPSEAVINGIDYSPSGSGSYEINGAMTLFLGNNDSANADTWFVEYVELDGSITFDGFRTDDEADVTGTVTIPSGGFWFSNDVEFSLSENDFLDNPGFPIWDEVELTFTSITVSEDGDSWALGEGDWYLDIGEGSVTLDINSMTVEYDGSTYKLEDTEIYAQFGVSEPAALAAAQPLADPEVTNFQFSGIEADNGTFYHPELGVIYFSGDLTETDPPGDITEGELNFYDAATDGDSVFFIYFGYDELYNEGEGATVYELNMDTEEYFEIGYFIDGTFIPDATAPGLG